MKSVSASAAESLDAWESVELVEFFVTQFGDRGVGVYSEAVEGDVFDAEAGEAFCGEEALDDHAEAFFGFLFYDQSNGSGLPCDLFHGLDTRGFVLSPVTRA
ncbi:MAG: hypothetical protein AB7J13_07605 [Pyrinomonadaceae bacterium]